MKSITRILIVSAVSTIVAAAAFAQLSADNQNWAKGPVQFIMTAQEQQQWNQVKTDAEAKAFQDLFWARRSPQYKQAFEQEVDYADKNFTEGRKRGSMTDRGRILVLLGAPSRIERSGNQGTSGMAMPGSTGGANDQQQQEATQIWVYEPGKSPVLGNQQMRVTFIDQFGNNTWALQRSFDVNDLTRRSITTAVVNPNAQAPAAQPAMTERQPQLHQQPAAQAAPLPTNTLKTEALRTAIADVKAGKTAPSKFANVTFTELVSPTGDYFVPVQLYIPKSAGLTADQVTTFFGTIEDNGGNVIESFEEPATLSTSNGDLYFDRSLTMLKPGTYRATFGLTDKDGKPVVLTSQNVELKNFATGTPGISRLVLANDVHQTDTAAVAGAPYAFGRVKIVPKGDRVFTNKDEITYFVEVVNPGIDPGSNMPKLQVKLELAGQGTKDKPGRTISAPIADATALPLTGAPGAGQYAIMAGIPLGDMKTPLPAGDYTLRVKVYDQVSKQSWTAEQPLTLVNAGGTTTATKSSTK